MVTTPRAGEEHPAEQRRLRRIIELAFARLPPAARRSVLHAFGKVTHHGRKDSIPFRRQAQMEWARSTGPPDFVGIGAQKAGTTWWFGCHLCTSRMSSLVPTFTKSDTSSGAMPSAPFGRCGVLALPRLVPASRRHSDGRVDSRLHAYRVGSRFARTGRAPDPAARSLLRDPVERFRSGLAHQRRDRGKLTAEIYQDALTRGLYDDALQPWTAFFPPEQVLLLQYERCRADPATQLARTYQFLGLEPFDHEGHRGNA